MCLECRVLGAIIHHHPEGVAEIVSKFSKFDFRPLPFLVKEHLVDVASETYLSTTLQAFKSSCNLDFKVIKVDSDGSCLPYAVSRCLIGKEILYDVLREALHNELLMNEEFYSNQFGQHMNESTWKTHFQGILEEAFPSRGFRTSRWLGPGEHLMAMANVLARPILLLDELSAMQQQQHGMCSGMFFPLRLTRAEVLQKHDGRMPSPIVIAWANEKHNHFVSLIRTSRSMEDQRQLFLENEDFIPTQLANLIESACFPTTKRGSSAERNSVRKVEMPIQVPLTGQCEFVSLSDSESGEEVKVRVPPDCNRGDTFKASFYRPHGPLESAFMALLMDNSQTPRLRALKTLHTIMHNLVEAFLTTNFPLMEKCSKLKLDNAIIKSNILCARGALSLLLASGFKQTSPQLLEFSQFGERTVLIRDCLRLASETTLLDVEGQVAANSESELFGLEPPCCWGSSWKDMRVRFASDGPESSPKLADKSREELGVWIFASGVHPANAKAIDSLMLQVQEDFASLALNSEFERIEWNDVVLFNKRLMTVQCASCFELQEWTGPVDGLKSEMHTQLCVKCEEKLQASRTGARTLLNFVGACAKEGTVGAKRCSKCQKLRLGKGDCSECGA